VPTLPFWTDVVSRVTSLPTHPTVTCIESHCPYVSSVCPFLFFRGEPRGFYCSRFNVGRANRVLVRLPRSSGRPRIRVPVFTP